MNAFLEFFSLTDPNIRSVVLSCMLLGGTASVVGVFGFLRKKSLVGEAVAHSMLPGIGMAFLLSGTREPWLLILGAVVSGWLSIVLMDWISRQKPMKPDLSMAITLTGFFGLGVMLLTHIQRSQYGDHSGLDHYIFGNAAAMTQADAVTFGGLALFVLIVQLFALKEFTLVSFNKDFASATGLPTRALDILLNTLNILAIAAGIKAVGLVLMASLLLIPAAASRFWSKRMKQMIIISALFGALSGVLGCFISFLSKGMPTGPVIVVVLVMITAVGILFAPVRGMYARHRRSRSRENRMLAENLAKVLYQKGEKAGNFELFVELGALRQSMKIPRKTLLRSVRLALARGWLIPKMGEVRLTVNGAKVGHKVNRLHRLWEIYMARKAGTPLKYVHQTAEVIEHLLTPEIADEMRRELGLCESFDPKSEIHQRSA